MNLARSSTVIRGQGPMLKARHAALTAASTSSLNSLWTVATTFPEKAEITSIFSADFGIAHLAPTKIPSLLCCILIQATSITLCLFRAKLMAARGEVVAHL